MLRLGRNPRYVRLSSIRAPRISPCRRVPMRPTPWAEKDMAIVLKEADSAGMSLPLAGLVREQIKDFKRRKGYPTPKVEEE